MNVSPQILLSLLDPDRSLYPWVCLGYKWGCLWAKIAKVWTKPEDLDSQALQKDKESYGCCPKC